MRKYTISAISFLTLSILLLVTACSSTSSTPSNDNDGSENGEQLRLRASSGAPDSHAFHVGFIGPLLERVEAETDVSFDIFTAGELVQLGGEYDAMRQGSIDIALTLVTPYDTRFPYAEVSMLPLLESDTNIATAAMFNLMNSDVVLKDGKTFYELEFGDKGLVAFAMPTSEPYVLATRDGYKMESASDFKESTRIRFPSRVHSILAENLGFTPINLSATDLYDSFSRNSLDGMFLSVHDWPIFNVDGSVKHAIEGANFGHFIAHLAMTEETWNKMGAETQEKFIQAASEIIFTGTETVTNLQERGAESYKEKGGEFTHLSELDPAVQAHISEAIVKTWLGWIEDLEAEGHAGKEMAMLWRDLLVAEGAVLPQEIMGLQ